MISLHRRLTLNNEQNIIRLHKKISINRFSPLFKYWIDYLSYMPKLMNHILNWSSMWFSNQTWISQSIHTDWLTFGRWNACFHLNNWNELNKICEYNWVRQWHGVWLKRWSFMSTQWIINWDIEIQMSYHIIQFILNQSFHWYESYWRI